MTASSDVSTKRSAFRKLHESGCFVIPNPWDAGGAVFLEQAGFKAVATTSAGFAFALGYPDSVRAIRADMMLRHVREIVDATSLPVNADFQSGFGDTVDELAKNVRACVETGVAGLSIEDASGDPASPLYDRARAVERVRAARAAIDNARADVVLTARCEAWLVGQAEPAQVAMDRLVAFAEAGADCLFSPGVRDLATIREIVRAVAPKPVNVLVSTPSPDLTVAKLAEAGVRRISVGSALSRVAWGAFMGAARSIAATGTFDALVPAASFAELNALFGARGG